MLSQRPFFFFVKSKLFQLLLLLNELGYSSSQLNLKDATVISFDFLNFYLPGTCLYYSFGKTFFQGSKYLFTLVAAI